MSRSAAPGVCACALALCLLPLRGGAQERPPPRPDSAVNLGHLPEIDDLSEEQTQREAPPRPPVVDEPPRMAMPYLGQMLSEPEIDFVPSTPTAGVNPHAVWEGMMVPPPPSQGELRARRLRNAGIGLLTVGTALALIAVPSLASSTDAPILQGVGFSTLTASALSFGAGGTLFGLGDQRLRSARRNAAGLALGAAPGGLALTW
jgi:hypothetical protein